MNKPGTGVCPWWYDHGSKVWKYRMENTNVLLTRVHTPDTCVGESCPVHMPTDHQYRHLPQTFKEGVMYRVKADGKLIVDPDDPAAHVRPWKRRGRTPYNGPAIPYDPFSSSASA